MRSQHDDPASAAWQRLLDALGGAGQVVTGPLGARDDRERAEGFRHLTRVLSIATEMLLEKGDPVRPAFTRWMSPHRKMLGDNPGTIYDAALVSPAAAYRLTGTRGTCAYLGFCVYGTGTGGARRIVGNLDDDELAVAADGSFELWLAATRPAAAPSDAAFLALEPDATDLMVRQYYAEPDEMPATYTITAVPDAGPPEPLGPAELARRLDRVGAYVRDTVELETTLSALMATATPALLRSGNEYVDAGGEAAPPPIDPAVVARAMPSSAIQYSGSWFDDLGDGEAIVVEGTVPHCRYWSVQLLTRWMESGDYVHHPVALTGRDIVATDEGRFRVVVAHRDPGTPNWIATTGLTSANIAVRALRAEGLLDVQFHREPLP